MDAPSTDLFEKTRTGSSSRRRFATIISFVSLFTLTSGCAPGTFYTDSGASAIRTALFRVADGGTTVLLSTGVFACEVPEYEDPQEQLLALVALTTAACREGSKHVVFRLYGGSDGGLGRFRTGDPLQYVEGEYLSVEEAELSARIGLERVYTTTDVHHDTDVTGWVDIRRNDTVLAGSFLFDNVDGRFTASPCSSDAGLFELLEVSPVASCP